MTIIKPTPISHPRSPSKPTIMPAALRAQVHPPEQFARPRGLRVQGYTEQSGTPYVEFVNRNTRLLLPLADVRSNTAQAEFQASNIILTKAEWADLQADVDRLTDFPPKMLAKRPGWTGGSYVLTDGTVIAPPGSEPAVPLFDPVRGKCRQAGTLKGWKRGVIGAVERSTLPTFAVMMPFAAPLLAVVGDIANYGIEFVGSDRDKLDSLQCLAASAVGCPDGTTRERYALSGTMPPAELLNSLTHHADRLLVIADVDRYAANGTKRTRGARLDELLVGLADGAAAVKLGATPAEPARFVFLMTSSESISSALAHLRPIANDRAAEHVFTVPVGRLKRGSSVARKVQNLASVQHGTSMVHFLNAVVKARSEDEVALRQRILGWRSEFRERVAHEATDLATDRAIAAFGLVYAAGRLAKAYGALPRSLKCMRAAVACYDAHRTTVAGEEPFLDRLRALAADPRTLRVDPRNLPSISDAELDRLPAILRANPRGKDELLLTPAALGRAFPSKKLLLRDPSLVGIIKHDGKRHTVKRAIRIEKQSDRVVSITLP